METPETIGKKVNEIQQYFITKLIAGQFDLTEVKGDYQILITINDYKFTLWATDYNRKIEVFGTSFMGLIFSPEQTDLIYPLLLEKKDIYTKKIQEEQAAKEYEAFLKMKEKFEPLETINKL